MTGKQLISKILKLAKSQPDCCKCAHRGWGGGCNQPDLHSIIVHEFEADYLPRYYQVCGSFQAKKARAK